VGRRDIGFSEQASYKSIIAVDITGNFATSKSILTRHSIKKKPYQAQSKCPALQWQIFSDFLTRRRKTNTSRPTSIKRQLYNQDHCNSARQEVDMQVEELEKKEKNTQWVSVKHSFIARSPALVLRPWAKTKPNGKQRDIKPD
jgi:hypothetical protein